MALLTLTKLSIVPMKISAIHAVKMQAPVRTLISKQLMYAQFGDPLDVIKYKEAEVPKLGDQEVLVRMLAAPINPADINTIQGRTPSLPYLPAVPGDEGVGNIVEIGRRVSKVEPGDRVIVCSRLLGTWRYYGVYDEREVHVISPNVPLPEAAMLSIAPCMAYRMIKDFYPIRHGQTVIQNAANSACGQCVIQVCRALGINTINIVASHCHYDMVKKHLLSIGGNAVYTLEEAECLKKFDTSLVKPVLGLNCFYCGRSKECLINHIATDGAVVHYGCAYDLPYLPIYRESSRPDLDVYKFHLTEWQKTASQIELNAMLKYITQLIVTGKFYAPLHAPVELKNYVTAVRNTVRCEAFSTYNYVFDFTLP